MDEVFLKMEGRNQSAYDHACRSGRGTGNGASDDRSSRGLCVVDEAPIRHAALEAYRAVKRELEEAEQRLLNFQENELPAFRLWMHKELGPTISRLRELEERYVEESALHGEILRERDRNGGSYHAAWLRVKARRDVGIPEAQDFVFCSWQRQHERHAATAACNPPEGGGLHSEADANFGEWENLSDSEFEKTAEAFDAVSQAMARLEGDESYIASAQEVINRERRRRQSKGRLKDLYRKLARMLHPDSNAALSEKKRRLWQDVQEAYRLGNASQLELLLHRVNADGEILPATASVAMIREVTERMHAALSEIRLQLLLLQDDPAWGFLTRKGKSLSALKMKMQESLDRLAEEMRNAIQQLRLTLRRWAGAQEQGARKSETGGGRAAKSRFKNQSREEQIEFPL